MVIWPEEKSKIAVTTAIWIVSVPIWGELADLYLEEIFSPAIIMEISVIPIGMFSMLIWAGLLPVVSVIRIGIY